MSKTIRKLSDRMIDREPLPSGEKRYKDIWDTSQTGLFVRIGKKKNSFYCYDSKARRSKLIGHFGYSQNEITVDQARDKARDIIRNGTLSNIYADLLLGEYIDQTYQYERSIRKPVSDATINKIKSDFQDWLQMGVSSITKEMLLQKINLWRNGQHKINNEHYTQRHRTAVRNSDSTIRKKVVQIKALFNTLVEHKRIPVNPFAGIRIEKDKPPKHISFYDENITYEDLMRFILQEERPFDETTSKFRKDHSPAARIFIATVIRLGLRDAEARLNTIDNFITTGKNTRLIIPANICKTKTSREIPIECPILLAAINEYKQEHYIQNPERFMFFNPSTRKVFSPALGRKLFDEIKERFGLGVDGNGSGRKYDFRHTFATRIYDATGDVKLVADLIGDNINTTDKYYASGNSKKMRDAVKNLK